MLRKNGPEGYIHPDELKRRCEQIRRSWPEWRVRQEEQQAEVVKVPEVKLQKEV